MFIAIEGVDFTGKSTLVRELSNLLRTKGYEVFTTRSPGGSPDAEEVRFLMLHSTPPDASEVRNLLATASRLLTSEYLNVLQEGCVIISDRWTHSGYAYQVVGEGTDKDLFMAINDKVRKPDYYVLLDITEEAYKKRKAQRIDLSADIMEKKLLDADFFERVNNAILNTRLPGSNYVVITVNNQTPEELALEVYNQTIAIQ
jgi:dTMP kinase